MSASFYTSLALKAFGEAGAHHPPIPWSECFDPNGSKSSGSARSRILAMLEGPNGKPWMKKDERSFWNVASTFLSPGFFQESRYCCLKWSFNLDMFFYFTKSTPRKKLWKNFGKEDTNEKCFGVFGLCDPHKQQFVCCRSWLCAFSRRPA